MCCRSIQSGTAPLPSTCSAHTPGLASLRQGSAQPQKQVTFAHKDTHSRVYYSAIIVNIRAAQLQPPRLNIYAHDDGSGEHLHAKREHARARRHETRELELVNVMEMSIITPGTKRAGLYKYIRHANANTPAYASCYTNTHAEKSQTTATSSRLATAFHTPHAQTNTTTTHQPASHLLCGGDAEHRRHSNPRH